MSAQGWTPGSYLGAKDAAHADHYTAANASHIRVLLKDDNLGLGAGRGKSDRENFGLGSFQDILGRLNGKSGEQISMEQAVRADLGRQSYIERKWGPSRFVSGGYLVSEKNDGEKDSEASRKTNPKSDSRKTTQEKLVDSRIEVKSDAKIGQVSESSEKKSGETKEERRQRRLERRQKKELKRLKKAEQNVGTRKPEISDVANVTPQEANAAPMSVTQLPAPTLSFVGSRQAVRQRFIRQKKMASMDANAMREVHINEGLMGMQLI